MPLSRRSWLAVVPLVVALGGCGADAAPVQSANANATAATQMAPDPRCDALRAKLQEGLDAVREHQQVEHATLGVLTPECGKQIQLSDAPTTAFPSHPDDLWRIGSVTKTFTASALLQLRAAGRLDLEDPLDAWIPDFPNGANITLRQLANHTSGIYNLTDSAAFKADLAAAPHRKRTPEELIAYATAEPPYFAPGQGYRYSNTDYMLLGRVIEKATGDTVGHVIRDRTIAKAGLLHTFLDGAEPLGGDLVHGYDGHGTDVTNVIDPSNTWAAGAMTASASDVLDWAAALYGSTRVLDPAALAAMETPSEPSTASGTSGGYGLGVVIFAPEVTAGNGIGYGHTGAVPGFQSQMIYYPRNGRALVAIISDTGGRPNDLGIVAIEAFRAILHE